MYHCTDISRVERLTPFPGVFKWLVTILLYSGLLTDLGSVFSVVVQGDEALRFFMVALFIDVMCELLM